MEGSPLAILIAEDNDAHAKLAIRGLAHHRVINQVTRVADGEAVFTYLRQQPPYNDPALFPRPHLVLLDLRLPKINGLEVLRRLRESDEWRDIPVVILTSSEADRDVAQAKSLRANGYLVKPFDFDRLSQLLQELGFYWLAWNRPRAGNPGNEAANRNASHA